MGKRPSWARSRGGRSLFHLTFFCFRLFESGLLPVFRTLGQANIACPRTPRGSDSPVSRAAAKGGEALDIFDHVCPARHPSCCRPCALSARGALGGMAERRWLVACAAAPLCRSDRKTRDRSITALAWSIAVLVKGGKLQAICRKSGAGRIADVAVVCQSVGTPATPRVCDPRALTGQASGDDT